MILFSLQYMAHLNPCEMMVLKADWIILIRISDIADQYTRSNGAESMQNDWKDLTFTMCRNVETLQFDSFETNKEPNFSLKANAFNNTCIHF